MGFCCCPKVLWNLIAFRTERWNYAISSSPEPVPDHHSSFHPHSNIISFQAHSVGSIPHSTHLGKIICKSPLCFLLMLIESPHVCSDSPCRRRSSCAPQCHDFLTPDHPFLSSVTEGTYRLTCLAFEHPMSHSWLPPSSLLVWLHHLFLCPLPLFSSMLALIPWPIIIFILLQTCWALLTFFPFHSMHNFTRTNCTIYLPCVRAWATGC